MEVAIRSLIVLAFVFLASPKARADLITYNMTGTVSNIGSNTGNLAVHVGDRIGWTLQYDRSLPQMPGGQSPSNTTTSYIAATSPLFNFVDLTTHTPLPSPTNNPSPISGGNPLPMPGGNPLPMPGGNPLPMPGGGNSSNYVLTLNSGSRPNTGNPQFTATTSWMSPSDGLFGNATLTLGISPNRKLALPASDLAHLQLNGISFDIRSLHYGYQLPPSSLPALDLDVKADPLSAPVSSTPEPSALVLLSLGATVWIVVRLRSWRKAVALLARCA